MFQFIKENYEWIFSGLGCVILTIFFTKNKDSKSININQKGSKNSNNIQINNINERDKND